MKTGGRRRAAARQEQRQNENRISPVALKVAVSAYLFWVVWEIVSGIFNGNVPVGSVPWLAIAGVIFLTCVFQLLISEWVRYQNKSEDETS